MSAPEMQAGRPDEAVADFTVRLYPRRIEVTGNRSGRTGSATHTGRITWLFALLRALRAAGAYERLTPEGAER
jgi:hypothetical protein